MATSIPPDKHAAHHHYAHRNTQNGDFEHSWRKALHEAQRALQQTDPFTARGGAGGMSAAPAPMMASVSGIQWLPYPPLETWISEHSDFFDQYLKYLRLTKSEIIDSIGPYSFLEELKFAYINWNSNIQKLYDDLPLPHSWADLKPQPITVDGKTINNFGDWLIDNKDWYAQHAGKDIPSIQTFSQLSLQIYIPYLESIRLNSPDQAGSKLLAPAQEQSLLDVNTTDFFDLRYQSFKNNNREWFDAHVGKDFLSLEDWGKFNLNGYIALMEYIKAGGKIDFGVSSGAEGGNQPGAPSSSPTQSPAHGGELRKLTSTGDDYSCSDHSQDLFTPSIYSSCGYNLHMGCNLRFANNTICGAAVSKYFASASAGARCGTAASGGFFGAGTVNVCGAALSWCLGDASALTFTIFKAKGCWANETAGVICGVAAGLCGHNNTAPKMCGIDLGFCLIRNGGLSMKAYSLNICGEDVGLWCLLNQDYNPNLGWCYMNGWFKT